MEDKAEAMSDPHPIQDRAVAGTLRPQSEEKSHRLQEVIQDPMVSKSEKILKLVYLWKA